MWGEPTASGPLAVAQRYFDAWNLRDPERIVACFAEGGTYLDPSSDGELTGAAIGTYAAGLFAVFPDLTFDIVSASATGDTSVVGEWLMRGTNTGSFSGLPPTGLGIALPGVDLISVDGDSIRSVRGFFDPGALVRQLGLQVVVQPHALGPVEFGTSVRMNVGGKKQPGAFSVTVIEVRLEQEMAEVDQRSEQIMGELAKMPGFISAVSGTIGNRGYTVSAWEEPENPRHVLHEGGTHWEAMQRFFGPDFARGGTTTVWEPHHLNAMWVRCEVCGQMADAYKLNGACPCGAPLPEHPDYW
jgi:steroid delta-isomerase-like uncharacterized protein